MIKKILIIFFVTIVSFLECAQEINSKKNRKHINSINISFFGIQDDQCKKYLNKIKKQRRKEFSKEEIKRHITPIS